MLLNQKKVNSLLKKYSIKTPTTFVFKSMKELNGKKINFPVALKVDSAEILHKTDLGLVFINLKSISEIKEKIEIAEQILRKKKIRNYNFMWQEMVKGIELIIGMKTDNTFGKVIIFGLGGIFVEVLKDVSMRITPLSRKDCEEMIDEIKGKKMLDGFRNTPRVNKEKIIDLLLKISKLSIKEKEITDIDFNPVIANEKAAIVVDARIISGKNA